MGSRSRPPSSDRRLHERTTGDSADCDLLWLMKKEFQGWVNKHGTPSATAARAVVAPEVALLAAPVLVNRRKGSRRSIDDAITSPSACARPYLTARSYAEARRWR